MAPRRSHGGHRTADAALLAADRVLSKEDEYRQGVRKVQAMATILADRLAKGSDVEVALTSADGDADGGGNAFLDEQRERLKNLATGNAKRMRDVDAFIKAVAEVRDEVLRDREGTGFMDEDEAGAAGGDENDQSRKTPDYEKSILDKIEALKASAASSRQGDGDDGEEFLHEIRERLGEREPSREDEDLEVLGPAGGADDGLALKCPITGMIFDDPVKNKSCGHTYSRAGLMQMIRNNKHDCPVAGCANKRLSVDQVEDDVEMTMKVRRHRRREEQARLQAASQGLDEDLDDGGEDDGGNAAGGGGMTVIE